MISYVLQIIGFACIAVAAGFVHPVFGIFVAGVELVFMGHAIDSGPAVVDPEPEVEPEPSDADATE